MNSSNKLTRLVVCCLMLLIAAACKRDNQSFIYDEINQLTIHTSSDVFNVIQLSRLTIEPEIAETMPGTETYSYAWSTWVSGETDPPDTLSVEKNLDVEVNLIPGTYRLLYTVINNRTGVETYKMMNLHVVGAFNHGLLVAHDLGGRASLGFVRDDDEVFPTVAETVNSRTYPGSAVSAHYSHLGFVLFFTTEGVFRFNSADLSALGENAEIIHEKTTYQKAGYAVGKFLFDQFVVADGQIFAGYGNYPTFEGLVLDPFSYPLEGDFDIFPAVFASGRPQTYFYDNRHKRFVNVLYLQRNINVLPPTPAAAFNQANVGKTLIAFDKATEAAFGDVDYFVFEDIDGRYLYSMSYDDIGSTPTMALKIDYSQSPEFANATAFASSTVVQQLYYAVDNKIYLYDVPNNSAQLVYEFPGGYHIKDMEMLRPGSRRLMVGANNGAEGEVYFFDLELTGRFTGNTFVNKYTGFGDIKQINFRYPQ